MTSSYCCDKFGKLYYDKRIKIYASGIVKFDDHRILECPFCHTSYRDVSTDEEYDLWKRLQKSKTV